ncbi:hypothetical protein BJY24_005713 [Nocardia transvalensis]|uniref:Uncharacterized protein n=1 Tax=Nocardia transvalensis TaxID=37333 RepID=A0A7W9UKS8_9NOCA|nr:hypothetical protein [Nocardia transvalensis]MBB5916801.1 hypothetical protein [Nocardia transvalensis]
MVRLPTRSDTAARRAAEQVQSAARDYRHARRHLDTLLARIDTAARDSAVDAIDRDAAAALGELAAGVHGGFVRLVTSVEIGRDLVDEQALAASIAQAAELPETPPEPEPGR